MSLNNLEKYWNMSKVELLKNMNTFQRDYTEAYDKHTGVPRNAQMLSSDLLGDATFLERLRKIKEMYMDKNRKKIISSLFG